MKERKEGADMQKRSRITAAVLAALFALTILTSSIFIIEHADHDCTGDGCEICEEILICTTVLKTLSHVSAALAVAVAVKFCLENKIMRGYLEKHSEEVFNMLAMEWDKDLAMQARFDDGRDNGIEFVALNIINEGESLEKICKLTALPLKRIEELAQKIKLNEK